MGAWGGLCSFDVGTFRAQVLPAFAAGAEHPLIASTLAHVRRFHPYPAWAPPAFHGLAQLAPFYAADMSSCSLGRTFVVCDGKLVPRPSAASPCSDRWDYEELASLFEWVVTRTTLRRPTVLGLRFRSVEDLFPDELGPAQEARDILALLDGRARYWSHGSGGFGEGIRGWLDAEEAALLAASLVRPGAAMVQEYYQSEGAGVAAADQHCMRIEQFVAALEQAVADGDGLLWGRDLLLFYDHGRWLLPP